MGPFDPSILPIGRLLPTSVGLLMGLPLTLRLLPARREAAAKSWLASVLRFCTMAARWNSSRARRDPASAYAQSSDGF